MNEYVGKPHTTFSMNTHMLYWAHNVNMEIFREGIIFVKFRISWK